MYNNIVLAYISSNDPNIELHKLSDQSKSDPRITIYRVNKQGQLLNASGQVVKKGGNRTRRYQDKKNRQTRRYNFQ